MRIGTRDQEGGSPWTDGFVQDVCQAVDSGPETTRKNKAGRSTGEFCRIHSIFEQRNSTWFCVEGRGSEVPVEGDGSERCIGEQRGRSREGNGRCEFRSQSTRTREDSRGIQNAFREDGNDRRYG